MKRHWGLTIVTLLLAAVFISGCAKKTVLKEDNMPQKQAADAENKPAVGVTKKSDMKPAAPAKAEWEKKMEAMEEAKKAQTKKEAAANQEAGKTKEKTQAVGADKLYEFADINFDFDKFKLKDEARETLKKHAAWLNKNRDTSIAIEGHCDERGTAEYNLALGQSRANAAAKFISDLGIDEKRLKTISYGFERPLDPRHNEEAWSKNRRAHFDIAVTK